MTDQNRFQLPLCFQCRANPHTPNYFFYSSNVSHFSVLSCLSEGTLRLSPCLTHSSASRCEIRSNKHQIMEVKALCYSENGFYRLKRGHAESAPLRWELLKRVLRNSEQSGRWNDWMQVKCIQLFQFLKGQFTEKLQFHQFLCSPWRRWRLSWHLLILTTLLEFHRGSSVDTMGAYCSHVLKYKRTTEEKHDLSPYCSCSVVQGSKSAFCPLTPWFLWHPSS